LPCSPPAADWPSTSRHARGSVYERWSGPRRGGPARGEAEGVGEGEGAQEEGAWVGGQGVGVEVGEGRVEEEEERLVWLVFWLFNNY
jgi:hypothetical protein